MQAKSPRRFKNLRMGHVTSNSGKPLSNMPQFEDYAFVVITTNCAHPPAQLFGTN
jgi:protein-L-isoaspartate O-methyltransferase